MGACHSLEIPHLSFLRKECFCIEIRLGGWGEEGFTESTTEKVMQITARKAGCILVQLTD